MSKKVLLGTTAILLIAHAGTSYAQASSSADGAAAEAGDIIVTARKRVESIMRVPVVEVVLTKEQIQRAQLTDIKSLQTQVPSLMIGENVLGIGAQVSIRGVGSSSLDPGIDQSISLNIDGLQLSQGLAYRSATFDLSQVEVLKGPQALFFGKNSPGGVISLRTADPTDKAELIGSVGYEFEAKERRFELIGSGPLTDTLRVRLAGQYSKMDGFFRDPAIADTATGALNPRRNFAPSKRWVIRGTTIWSPTSKLDARLKVNFTRDRVQGDGGQSQYVSCPDGVAGPNGIQFVDPAEKCKLDRDISIVNLDPAAFPGVRNGGVPFSDLKQRFGSLELNYHLTPRLNLTSVTGYYRTRLGALFNSQNTGRAAPTLASEANFSRHDVTQELRLTSEFASPLNFTVGGFYQEAAVAYQLKLIGNSRYNLPALLQFGNHNLHIHSYSAYGQLRYKPIADLELAAGARWTSENRSQSQTNLLTNSITPLAVDRISSNNVSPEVTVTYTPTPDLTLFGSYKKGFKSGSFSVTTIYSAGFNNSFGDERVTGFEAGVKARTFDRQLSLNLAGYSYLYQGLQVGANVASPVGTIELRTINAGSARVKGVDFDMSFRPRDLPGFSLNGSANYNIGRFNQLVAPCWGGQTIAQGCNLVPNAAGSFTSQNLAGAPLTRAPKWQITGGFAYELPVGNDMSMEIASSAIYSTSYLADLLARADMYRPHYAKVNASLSLRGRNGAWEVSLIGNNLTNKITTAGCSNGNPANGGIFGGQITGGTARGPAGVDEVFCIADRGRELWLRLRISPLDLLR